MLHNIGKIWNTSKLVLLSKNLWPVAVNAHPDQVRTRKRHVKVSP